MPQDQGAPLGIPPDQSSKPPDQGGPLPSDESSMPHGQGAPLMTPSGQPSGPPDQGEPDMSIDGATSTPTHPSSPTLSLFDFNDGIFDDAMDDASPPKSSEHPPLPQPQGNPTLETISPLDVNPGSQLWCDIAPPPPPLGVPLGRAEFLRRFVSEAPVGQQEPQSNPAPNPHPQGEEAEPRQGYRGLPFRHRRRPCPMPSCTHATSSGSGVATHLDEYHLPRGPRSPSYYAALLNSILWALNLPEGDFASLIVLLRDNPGLKTGFSFSPVVWGRALQFARFLGLPTPNRSRAEDHLLEGVVNHIALLVHPRILALLLRRIPPRAQADLRNATFPDDFPSPARHLSLRPAGMSDSSGSPSPNAGGPSSPILPGGPIPLMSIKVEKPRSLALPISPPLDPPSPHKEPTPRGRGRGRGRGRSSTSSSAERSICSTATQCTLPDSRPPARSLSPDLVPQSPQRSPSPPQQTRVVRIESPIPGASGPRPPLTLRLREVGYPQHLGPAPPAMGHFDPYFPGPVSNPCWYTPNMVWDSYWNPGRMVPPYGSDQPIGQYLSRENRMPRFPITLAGGVVSTLDTPEDFLAFREEAIWVPTFEITPEELGNLDPDTIPSLLERCRRRYSAIGPVEMDLASELLPRQMWNLTTILDNAPSSVPVLLRSYDPHSRSHPMAIRRLLDVARSMCVDPHKPIVLQGFRGSPATVEEWVQTGCNVFFSINGSVTSFGPTEIEGIRRIPTNRLLVESSSPDFPVNIPHPMTPRFLGEVIHLISQVRGLPHEEVCRATFINGLSAFQGLMSSLRPYARP
ncbi:hypothetical protein FSP39_009681 [Pinctada imbricata]|uniref:Uncharacterized protein n=1 Tax=Pinctada imbricata TaxID=66713 RepID=A0AA88YNC7_PINIB|nr:hypothetical protein FSP39_009681 [Pinctada imbricata]